MLDGLSAVGDLGEIPVLVAVVAVIGALVLAWFFLLPALVFVADLLYIVLTAAIGVAIRVLFRRPWDVVAETDGPPPERIEIPVVGWRASAALVNEVAYDIERTGSPLPL